ncbi:MAG: polyprenyl synthetase family protein [Verrucomicrobiales bacterium]|nr:polyprenyl synthetase family protein [Verrucomicrobiales bacterium]
MASSKIQSVKLPSTIPFTTTLLRPPKKNIPQTKPERDALLACIRDYVEREVPVPPMPQEELEVHARKILADTHTDEAYLHYTAVVLNNEMWRETLASIPYERRLLLMPKCLRVEDKCPAPFDEFGLLCKQCGLCTIEDFQNEAERLGYAVLVAEGSAVVMSLIQTGKIEAIVGISCLPVLERTFPYVEAAAIPSIAVPLLQDDCINTTVDNDWVWEYIHLTSDDQTRRLNLNALHEDIREWFSEDSLTEIMGASANQQEKIAREWLALAGNRWRPFLTVATYQALREDRGEPIPEDIKKIAVAVECFHKASLIHDDIEDEDHHRYDQPTLHAQHGIPVALNAGDLLIGEGYRLISECDLSAEQKNQMIAAASIGQRELCLGQGAELIWAKNPEPLKTSQVLEIFRQKTSPAFEVALQLGAAYAGKLDEVAEVIHSYSENLGIAYQIRDDMDDLHEDSGDNALQRIRPSVLLSTTLERAKGDDKKFMQDVWSGKGAENFEPVNGFKTPIDRIRHIVRDTKTDERTLLLLETYKETAIRSLQEVDNANLKGLLRRVLGKVFNDLEIKGWCREFEVKQGLREEADVTDNEEKIAEIGANA